MTTALPRSDASVTGGPPPSRARRNAGAGTILLCSTAFAVALF